MNIKKEFFFIAAASLLFTYGLQAADVAHDVDRDAENKLRFQQAVESGSAGVPIVRGLLKNGLNVDTRIATGRHVVTSKTLASLAVCTDNIEVLDLLLEQKADVNLPELFADGKSSFVTPMSRAFNRPKMAAMLLAAGAQYFPCDHFALIQLEKGNPDFKAPLTEQQRLDALKRQRMHAESFASKQWFKKSSKSY